MVLLLKMGNEVPGGRSLVALREAGQKFMRGGERALIIVQDFGEKTRLIKKTVFVLRVLFLRRFILLERFLRLAHETKTITKVGADIGIVGAATDRLLVMLQGEREIALIIIPIAEGASCVARRKLCYIGRGRVRCWSEAWHGRARWSAAGRGCAHEQPHAGGAEQECTDDQKRNMQLRKQR